MSAEQDVRARRWTSRAELLQALASGLPEADRRALSLRRLVVGAACCAVTVLLVALAEVQLVEGSRPAGTVLLLLALLPLLPAARALRTGVRARREQRAWEQLERAHRDLPPGEVPRALRAPYDARDDDDVLEVATDAQLAEQARTLQARVLVRGALSGIGFGVGLVLVLSVLGDGPLGSTVLLPLTGTAVMAVSFHVGATATAHGWRSTRATGLLGLERERWAARRRLAGHDEPSRTVHGAGAVAAAVTTALLALPLVALLVAWTAQGRYTAAAAGLAVVVAVVVLAALPVLRARRLAAAVRRRVGVDGPVVERDGTVGVLVREDGALVLLDPDRHPLPPVAAVVAGGRPRVGGPLHQDLLHPDGSWTTLSTGEPRRLAGLLADLPRA